MTSFQDDIVAARPALLRFAISLLRNIDDAEDLVQSTLTRALAREQQFEPGTNIEAWLIVVAKSIRVNNIRTAFRRVSTVPDEHGLNMPVGGGQEEAIRRRDFWRAMHKIPHEQAVCVLRNIQGYSEREVTAELGVGKGTLRSRTHRGTASLRALITGDAISISLRGAGA